MEKIKVVSAKIKDRANFIKTFKGSYFDLASEATNHFNKYLEGKTLFLLFVNSNLVGFFNYTQKYSHDANYLDDVCVAEKFRSKGYSSYLLTRYIEICRKQMGRNKIALSSANKPNVVSQKMHIKFGFKKIGVLKGLHYGKDEIYYSYKLD
jgi:L-amino acid N-acyltransferase YncA